MYIPDLTPDARNSNRLHVGWLDCSHPFQKGDVSDQFKERLLTLCAKSKKTRGFHKCTLCDLGARPNRPLYRSKPVSMGSGEFEVHGKDWQTYSAPDLIYHYVVDHQYKPPQQFIDAVIAPRTWVLTLDGAIATAFLCLILSVICLCNDRFLVGTFLFFPMLILCMWFIGKGITMGFKRGSKRSY